MRPFVFEAPTSLDEAYRILSTTDGEVRPLLGGTDLISQMKDRRRNPAVVMDVKRIPEMKRLEFVAGEGLHIGAGVCCTDTSSFPAVREMYPSVMESCQLVGSIQIQNRAGIGGNVCNASPSGDTIPALLTYGGRAVIVGPRGRREVLLEEFFAGPGRTVLEGDEILLEIVLPPPPSNSSGHYLRFIPRNEMDIAVAGVASLLVLDGGGRCTQARIALAAVAPTPVRATAAEAVLEGQMVTEARIREAGERAVESCNPITDVRGSIEYRKELVKVLTRRTLQQCVDSCVASLGA